MKARTKLFCAMMVSAAFLIGEVGYAATLITMNGSTPAAGLAKSWKKVKDGEYSFELDTTAEMKKGEPVTAAAVKDSLETKLGAGSGVKVTANGSSVTVTYTVDEAKFLEQVSKTKIRAGDGDAQLAMTDSVSEGGLRAKPEDRAPVEGEVKATILKITKDVVTGTVLASKSKDVKEQSTVKVKGAIKGMKKGELFYFMPEKADKGVWTAKKGSVK